MTSQIAEASVKVVPDGPPYGEANESPMPAPSAMMIKLTAIAMKTPAIAALQENGVRLAVAPSEMDAAISSSTISCS